METSPESLIRTLDSVVKLHIAVLTASAALLLIAISSDSTSRLNQAQAVIRSLPIPRQDSLTTASVRAADQAYHSFLQQISDTIRVLVDERRVSPAFPSMLRIPMDRSITALEFENPNPEILAESALASSLDLFLPPRHAPLREQVDYLSDVRNHFFLLPNPDSLAEQLRRGIPSWCGTCEILSSLAIGRDSTVLAWAFVKDTMTASVAISLTDQSWSTSRSQRISLELLRAHFPPRSLTSKIAPWGGGGIAELDLEFSRDSLDSALARWDSLVQAWPAFASEYASLSPSEALARLDAEIAEERRSLSLLGLSLDEQLATIGGPLLLGLALVYLLLLVLHTSRMSSSGAIVREYPWPPLFHGLGGTISNLVMLVVIPAAGLGAFAVRVVSVEGTIRQPDTVSHWLGITMSLIGVLVATATAWHVQQMRKRHSLGNAGEPEAAPTSPRPRKRVRKPRAQ